MISLVPWPRRHLPTAELFGLAGNFRRISAGGGPMGAAYRVGAATVAVRLWRPAGEGPVHYLIDDDIPAGIADPSLPEAYRRRLEQAFRESVETKALDRIAMVITPSARLEERYRALGKEVRRLDPAWPVPQSADLRHFAGGGPVRVAFLGTRSHLADLELLRHAVEDPQRTWVFHHFLGMHAPGWLARQPHVEVHAPMGWAGYRRKLARLRFHVAVYPMQDTPFNLARSCNKVMEHAMVGAVSVFSTRVPFAGMIRDGHNALLAEDGDWPDLLRGLCGDASRLKLLAAAGHALGFQTAGQAAADQRELWAAVAAG